MDIIAAHRQGLLDKLDQECVDLVGRPQDFGQRAVVLHHLYDHSLGAHVWALLEARRQLDLARHIQLLKTRRPLWWRTRAARVDALQRLSQLADALGRESQRRALAAYRLYRIAGAPALKAVLPDEVGSDCAGWHDQAHERRRIGSTFAPDEKMAMAMAVEDIVGHDPDGEIGEAWDAMRPCHLYRPALKLLSPLPWEQVLADGQRKGWDRVEQQFRDNPSLPERFRINPAQHFYSLLHGLAERRQKEWVDGCAEERGAVRLVA